MPRKRFEEMPYNPISADLAREVGMTGRSGDIARPILTLAPRPGTVAPQGASPIPVAVSDVPPRIAPLAPTVSAEAPSEVVSTPWQIVVPIISAPEAPVDVAPQTIATVVPPSVPRDA